MSLDFSSSIPPDKLAAFEERFLKKDDSSSLDGIPKLRTDKNLRVGNKRVKEDEVSNGSKRSRLDFDRSLSGSSLPHLSDSSLPSATGSPSSLASRKRTPQRYSSKAKRLSSPIAPIARRSSPIAQHLERMPEVEEQRKLSLLERECKKKIQEVEERERKLEIQEKRMEPLLEDFNAYKVQSKEVLMELLIDQATNRRKEKRRNFLKNTKRYGYVQPERFVSGGTLRIVENWVPGEINFDIEQRLADVQEKKSKVKQRLALLRKVKQHHKTHPPNASGDTSALENGGINTSFGILTQKLSSISVNTLASSLSPKRLYVETSVLKSLNTSLLAEEKQIQEEEKRVDTQRALLFRETKRIRDEEKSKFRNFPLLQDRYLLLNLLGKGGFSEVYEGYDLEKIRRVACKIHQVESHWGKERVSNYTRHACREYNIHKAVDHPNIVHFYDVFEIDPNTFCTVMEFCTGGDLDSYLKEQKRLSVREARLVITQVVEGLFYLHNLPQPIIHYDLKPANIICDEWGGVKITDFGLSKRMESEMGGSHPGIELTSQGAGTYWYLPPECLQIGDKPPLISSKVDVWSLGVLLYQLLYGEKPFGNSLSQHQTSKLLAGNVTVQFPPKPAIPTDAKEFISQCLTSNQFQRPSIETLRVHKFVQMGVDST